MRKCLVTKLNGVSSNSDLLRIGEIRMHFDKSALPTTFNRGKNIIFTKDSQLEIIGDAYFTDKTFSKNLGKKIKNATSSVYVSNADCDVCILDKYSLKGIYDFVENNTNDNGNCHLSIDGLKYSTSLKQLILPNGKVSGDIASLKDLVELNSISLNNTQVSGDIASLKDLVELNSISLSNTQVSGDIASLKNLVELNSISLSNTQVSGDIASLKNLVELNSVFITYVTGDIEAFTNCTKLKTLRLDKSSGVKGDLASLPESCNTFTCYNSDTAFTWGTRPESAYILSLNGVIVLDNVDKMLQDQSKCKVSSGDKRISCTGTRTSASDSAVQALQDKGYTVSIKPLS